MSETTKSITNHKSEVEIEENDAVPGSESPSAPANLSYNPSMPDDDANLISHLEQIRGDAIGDTLYSERFVLSTLLRLSKVKRDFELADGEEAFEADLCSVWDMTVEKAVVEVLLKHQVLEIFAACLEVTQDKRLAEVLVGILGNMCIFENARIKIADQSKVISTVLQLIACSDSLTLIQLMRLLTVAHVYDDPVDVHLEWYDQIQSLPTFVHNFAYILQNSVNETLLKNALEALNAIQANCLYRLFDAKNVALKNNGIFRDEDLIHATIEAFKTLVPFEEKHYTKKRFSGSPPTTDCSTDDARSARKTIQIFLNIHAIFVLFKDRPNDAKLRHLEQLIPHLTQILEICNAQYLLPPNPVAQDILENVDDIISGFEDPYDDALVTQIIMVWNLLRCYTDSHLQILPANDFERDSSFDNGKSEELDVCSHILETIVALIARVVSKASTDLIESTLLKEEPNVILELINTLGQQIMKKESFRSSHQKLLEAYESLSAKESNKSVTAIPSSSDGMAKRSLEICNKNKEQ